MARATYPMGRTRTFAIQPRYIRRGEKTVDKRQEFKLRAEECTKVLHGLMTEAKREGYAVEVFTHLDTSGEPKSRVTVVLR